MSMHMLIRISIPISTQMSIQMLIHMAIHRYVTRDGKRYYYNVKTKVACRPMFIAWLHTDPCSLHRYTHVSTHASAHVDAHFYTQVSCWRTPAELIVAMKAALLSQVPPTHPPTHLPACLPACLPTHAPTHPPTCLRRPRCSARCRLACTHLPYDICSTHMSLSVNDTGCVVSRRIHRSAADASATAAAR